MCKSCDELQISSNTCCHENQTADYGKEILQEPMECGHEIFIRNGGVKYLLYLMKNFEYSEDIQVNSTKVIGDLTATVYGDVSYVLEDFKLSETIITSMLNYSNNPSMQLFGCITLTNLAIQSEDNMYTVLKSGGIYAGLQALRQSEDVGATQLYALKLLSILTKSNMGCRALVDEAGVDVLHDNIQKFYENHEIVKACCQCLQNLPNKGVDKIATEKIESIFLDLRLRMPNDIEVANSLCTFYENILKIDRDSSILSETILKTIIGIMNTFDNMCISLTCCRIISLLASANRHPTVWRDVVETITMLMGRHETDCDIQIVCIGTIYFIASKGCDIEWKEQNCGSAILEARKRFPKEDNLQEISTLALAHL